MTPDPELRLADGRYVVRGILGEGAQGLTYDAADTRDGSAVAIKRFDVRGARSWKDVELAEREARVLATLDHPLVPRYIEHFEENGALYLVMQKIEGETLDAICRREGPLPEDEVRRFLACADRALTYLHGRASPIVHRDIKPRNVVRRPDGTYVLVDFGTVSELIARRGASTVAGTFGYMAPEQFQGRAMPATDVYAVGATALAALTGIEPDLQPHRGLRIDVRTARHGRGTEAMTASLERMLEPDPEHRPTSLGPVLDGIRSAGPSHTSAPPHVVHTRHAPHAPHAPAVAVGGPAEDAIVKSIRNLLWVLWGLGWIIVPLIMSRFGAHRLIPLVMFGSLAALFVVTWHKGAFLRSLLRGIRGDHASPPGALTPPHVPARTPHRIEVGSDERVRVHTSDLRAEELVGRTEVQGSEEHASPPRARTR